MRWTLKNAEVVIDDPADIGLPEAVLLGERPGPAHVHLPGRRLPGHIEAGNHSPNPELSPPADLGEDFWIL